MGRALPIGRAIDPCAPRAAARDPEETLSFPEYGHSSGSRRGYVSTIAFNDSLNLSEPIQLTKYARYLVHEAWAATYGPSGCVSRNQSSSL
jgi:hypothetical protein